MTTTRLIARWHLTPALACLLFTSLLALLAAPPARAQDATTALIDGASASYDLWPAVRLLADADARLTVTDVAARPGDFGPVRSLPGNLGRRDGAVWLRVPLKLSADAATRWVLDIDYASLDRVDIYLLDGSRIEQQALLGDHVPVRQRAWLVRAHALVLDLPPGKPRELLLKVQTTGSMIVPLWLRTPADYQAHEDAEQALQGLIAGMGLCLLLYSLAQWASLRDPMFGLYALTVLGTVGFFAALSGMGPQHIWGGSDWFTRNAAPWSILIGVGAAFFFVLRALDVRSISPRVATAMVACGSVAFAAALLFVLGLLTYGEAQGVGMALSPMPLILVLPTAFKRLRSGDRAAAYVLGGWGAYSVGTLVLVGLLTGRLPLNFWTTHAFQFSSMLEMAAWMMVLAVRVDEIRLGAMRLRGERDELRSLSRTDPLTGLLNRRGLMETVPALLSASRPGQSVAVFLLDLDGFKAINDRLGHEAGDALLAAFAERLRHTMRTPDLLCRLGGDEFVAVAGSLVSEIDAARMGDKLLQALTQPFDVRGVLCRVGVTVGYALAPQDDSTLEGLIKRADVAMYLGKQSGRNCVRRGASGAGVSGI